MVRNHNLVKIRAAGLDWQCTRCLTMFTAGTLFDSAEKITKWMDENNCSFADCDKMMMEKALE